MFTVDGKFRTSIIVDPPNGRMPPMTEARMEALRSQRRGREIFLRVHPSRAPFLQGQKSALIAVLGRARSIEIREDITLGRDGCVVETDAGMLDVGLGTQLSALFEGIAP